MNIRDDYWDSKDTNPKLVQIIEELETQVQNLNDKSTNDSKYFLILSDRLEKENKEYKEKLERLELEYKKLREEYEYLDDRYNKLVMYQTHFSLSTSPDNTSDFIKKYHLLRQKKPFGFSPVLSQEPIARTDSMKKI